MTKLTNDQLITLQLELETTSLNDSIFKKQISFESNISGKTEYNNAAYGSKFLFVIADVVSDYIRAQLHKSNQHKTAFYFEHIRPIQEQQAEDVALNATIADKWNKVEVTDVEARIGELVALSLVSSLSKGSAYTPACRAIYKDVCWLLNIHPESDYHGMAYIAKLVTIVSEDTNFFSLVQPVGRDIFLEASPEAKQMVDEARDNIQVSAASHRPMLSAPTPFKSLLDTEGGALKMRTPLLKRPRKVEDGKISSAIKNFTAENNKMFFDIINNKMATGYCVNTPLLLLIKEYYAMGYSFKSFDTEVNSIQADIDAKKEIEERNEKRRKFKDDVASGKRPVPKPKKKRGQVVEQKWDPEFTPLSLFTRGEITKSHMNKYANIAGLTNSILDQASFYSDFERMYYPVHLDHRSRGYTYATEFSYQGSQLAKALIHFADKQVVNEDGIVALFETLGNALNWDKLPLPVKRKKAVQWWKENKGTFANGDYSMFFLDSHKEKDNVFDEPITAMGLVVELLAIEADPEHKTGIVLHRDARLSGSSIIGTILRDREVMSKTSVLPEAPDAEALEDGYRDAADHVKNKLTEMAEDGSPIAYDLLQYADKLMTRKALKFPTMAGPSYGLTEYGIREHNKSLICWADLTKEHKDLYDVTVIASLRATLPSSFIWLDTINKVAGTVIKNAKSFCFTQPLTGFPVEMWSQVEVTKRAEIARRNGPPIKVSLKMYTDKVDTAAIAREVSPSLTHSIDAALLILVDRGIKGAYPTATIHDSIGSRPNDVKNTVDLYRKIMHALATSNLFSTILDQLGSDVEVPYQNTATAEDIASILEAQHILC